MQPQIPNEVKLCHHRFDWSGYYTSGSRTVWFFRFKFGLGSTAVSNFDSVSVKVQIKLKQVDLGTLHQKIFHNLFILKFGSGWQ